ncbi:hypothetical protein [Sediminicoccus sp. KRV36]|uniref:DUF6931 family protein n=1 Tax=Sediminicoccus sp. KRV36 TaxID=3133721 RepID=UPI00200D47C9|nr:hypothetical protein [Sediminicoccus rosea]UPY37741.1 hypothetical protein LHU95_03340 [Sediminicoccus rosea]
MSAPPDRQSPNKLARPIEAILPFLELDAPTAAQLASLADAAKGLEALLAADRAPDALRLIAHALPKREAVWWACMCARAVPALTPNPLDAEALTAAELWVRRPDEASRRGTMEVAQKGGFRSAESWAAVGAFWSGGNMSAEGQPEVLPAEHLTGVAVVGAIMMAAMRHTPERAPARFIRFVASARDIAGGGAGRIPPEEG